VAYADDPDLVIEHKYYLDMISWAKEDSTTKITQAFPCVINKGTLDAHLPARIYVDDALLLGLSRRQMELRLAALFEAIFVIMGTPDTTVHQCPLALGAKLSKVNLPSADRIPSADSFLHPGEFLQDSRTFVLSCFPLLTIFLDIVVLQ